jgi:signal peptidase II
MKKTHAVLLMLLLTALDQASKAWVVANVPLNTQSVLIPNLINLTHIKNPGVSLGMLSDMPEAIRTPLLVGLSAVISVGMLVYLLKNYNSTENYARLGLVFIIPGAVGNLIDRILHSHVTDFLQFRWYEVGFFSNNFADIYISAGVVIFLAGMWLGSKKSSSDVSR